MKFRMKHDSKEHWNFSAEVANGKKKVTAYSRFADTVASKEDLSPHIEAIMKAVYEKRDKIQNRESYAGGQS